MVKFRKLIAAISVAALLSTFCVVVPAAQAEWYTDAIAALDLQGTPGKNINRCEAAVIWVKALGVDPEVPDPYPFTDVPTWCKGYAGVLYNMGVVEGYKKANGDPTGKYGANDGLNRAAQAVMTVKALGLTEKATLTAAQEKEFAGLDWAKEAFQKAVAAELIKGKPGGILDPKGNNTLAEAAVVSYRAIQEGLAPGIEEEEVVPDEDEEVVPDEEEVVLEPGGEFSVALAPDSPTATTLADSTAFNTLLKLEFTAGSDAGSQITALKVNRKGLIADTNVKLSVWDSEGVRHGGVVTVSEAYAEIDFSTEPIAVAAGESATITIKANLGNSNSATLQLAIAALEDITTNGTLSGSFPIESPAFTIVDGASSVGTVTVDVRDLASTTRNVDIGQKDYELTKFELSETSSNEAVYFDSLTLFNNGNTADGDLTNFVLKDQTGETLATVAAGTKDKIVTFTFAEPYELGKGVTRYFSVYVDIAKGASRTGQFLIQNDYDIVLRGLTTGAFILATNKTGGTDATFPIGDIITGLAGYNHMTLNEGTLSVSKDNTSPSGDVTLGASDVILGRFKLEAQGEDIEIQRISIDLEGAGADAFLAAANTTTKFECVSSSACDLTGSIKVQTSAGKSLLTVAAATESLWDHSASSTYHTLSAYHTIKAGASEVVTILANLSSSTTQLGAGETIQPRLVKVYYYKKNSLKYADSSAATANSQTATASALTVSSNSAYGAQSIVSGTAGVKLGSFIVKAGAAEDVRLTSVTLSVNDSGVATSSLANVTNLKLMKYIEGGTDVQLGSTQATVTDSTDITISISGQTIPAGEQIQIDIYGDTNVNLAGNTLTVTLAANGVKGSGVTSTSSPQGPTVALALQVITGATTGTLTVAAATDNPVSDILVAGSTGNSVLKIKLTASAHEDIYIKELSVYNDTNADDVALSSLSLYEGDTLKGTLSLQKNDNANGNTNDPGYVTWNFTGANRPKVPKNGSSYLTVKANMVSSQQDATVSGKTPKLALGSMKAEGFAAITPTIIAAAADSATTLTANLAVTGTGGGGGGCVLNTAVNDITTTTFAFKTCTDGATAVPIGTVITIGDSTEQLLVTASTNVQVTVTRAYNGTTADATNAADGAFKYAGALTAAAANKIVPIVAIESLTGPTADATNCAAGAVCTSAIGQIVTVGSEAMYVYNAYRSSTGNHDLLYVVRGVNGTTIATAAASATLNEITTAPGMVAGSAHYVYNTKPTIAAGSLSPSGAKSSTTGMLVGEFVVSAASNTADVAENYLNLVNLDISFIRSSVTLANLKLYPKNKDQDATYAVAIDGSAGYWLTGNVARFLVSGDTDWGTGGYDKVVEGQSQTYVLRADVTNAVNGSLQIKLGNLGTAGQASLGAGASAGDVHWTDNAGTAVYWVKQASSEVAINETSMTFAAAYGSHDSTGPTVTFLTQSDGTHANHTANTLEDDNVCAASTTAPTLACDHATIVFSEAIDPTTINSSLIPAGAVNDATLSAGTAPADTTTITSPAAIALTGGIDTILNGTAAGGILTYTGIMTNTAALGATVADGNLTPYIAIDGTGKLLKIYDLDVNAVVTVAASSAAAGLTTTVKDLNGTLQTAGTPTVTGRF